MFTRGSQSPVSSVQWKCQTRFREKEKKKRKKPPAPHSCRSEKQIHMEPNLYFQKTKQVLFCFYFFSPKLGNVLMVLTSLSSSSSSSRSRAGRCVLHCVEDARHHDGSEDGDSVRLRVRFSTFLQLLFRIHFTVWGSFGQVCV